MKSCKYIKVIICILFLGIAGTVNIVAQVKDLKKLKEQQKKINREIIYSTKLLKTTKSRKEKTINQLYIIERQIKKRDMLIKGYNEEIVLIDKEINKNLEKIDSIKNRIDELKKDYINVVREFYKINKVKGNIMAYIFAARSVNQAYKRIKYYQQYLDYGKKLYSELKKAEEKYYERNIKLRHGKEDKRKVVGALREEENKYRHEKGMKSQYIADLQKKERGLQREIRKKGSIKKKVEKEIEKLVAEERKRRKGYAILPEERILSDKFSGNKGKLPWPTEKGMIIKDFGEHSHPVLKYVIVKNDGIDIITDKGSYARTVFEGVVRKIVAIPGANEIIIIKHGVFYTVYQNIIKVSVKTGQYVNAKENIGLIYTNTDNNETVLHFEIWKGRENENPILWLAKNR